MDLSDFFTTKAQATDFSLRLNAIIDQMFTTTFDLDKTLMQEFGLHKKDAFIKLMRENNVSDTSHGAIQEFLKKIQEAVANLPVVSLTIAFEPTDETLKALSQWFLLTLNKQVIFEISFDLSLIAGATITYNGKFKDYSVRSLFTTVTKNILSPAPTTHVQQPATSAPTQQSTEHITIGR